MSSTASSTTVVRRPATIAWRPGERNLDHALCGEAALLHCAAQSLGQRQRLVDVVETLRRDMAITRKRSLRRSLSKPRCKSTATFIRRGHHPPAQVAR